MAHSHFSPDLQQEIMTTFATYMETLPPTYVSTLPRSRITKTLTTSDAVNKYQVAQVVKRAFDPTSWSSFIVSLFEMCEIEDEINKDTISNAAVLAISWLRNPIDYNHSTQDYLRKHLATLQEKKESEQEQRFLLAVLKTFPPMEHKAIAAPTFFEIPIDVKLSATIQKPDEDSILKAEKLIIDTAFEIARANGEADPNLLLAPTKPNPYRSATTSFFTIKTVLESLDSCQPLLLRSTQSI